MTQTHSPWRIQGTLTLAKTPSGPRQVDLASNRWLLGGILPTAPCTVAGSFEEALSLTKANPAEVYGSLSIHRILDGAYLGGAFFEDNLWQPCVAADPGMSNEDQTLDGASQDLTTIAEALSKTVGPVDASEVRMLHGILGIPLTDPTAEVVAMACVSCPQESLWELAPPMEMWAGTQPLVVGLHRTQNLVLRCVAVQDGELRLYPGDVPVRPQDLFGAIQARLGRDLLPDVQRRWALATHLRTHLPENLAAMAL